MRLGSLYALSFVVTLGNSKISSIMYLFVFCCLAFVSFSSAQTFAQPTHPNIRDKSFRIRMDSRSSWRISRRLCPSFIRCPSTKLKFPGRDYCYLSIRFTERLGCGVYYSSKARYNKFGEGTNQATHRNLPQIHMSGSPLGPFNVRHLFITSRVPEKLRQKLGVRRFLSGRWVNNETASENAPLPIR